jgi:5-carboxymethyl-2-hydroxymuconate isomerase
LIHATIEFSKGVMPEFSLFQLTNAVQGYLHGSAAVKTRTIETGFIPEERLNRHFIHVIVKVPKAHMTQISSSLAEKLCETIKVLLEATNIPTMPAISAEIIELNNYFEIV